jgi:hypothetical protein
MLRTAPPENKMVNKTNIQYFISFSIHSGNSKHETGGFVIFVDPKKN